MQEIVQIRERENAVVRRPECDPRPTGMPHKAVRAGTAGIVGFGIQPFSTRELVFETEAGGGAPDQWAGLSKV